MCNTVPAAATAVAGKLNHDPWFSAKEAKERGSYFFLYFIPFLAKTFVAHVSVCCSFLSLFSMSIQLCC